MGRLSAAIQGSKNRIQDIPDISRHVDVNSLSINKACLGVDWSGCSVAVKVSMLLCITGP